MKHFYISLSLAVLVSACAGGRSPLSPSPTFSSSSAGAGPAYTLSGVVSVMTEAGPVPVAGVQVEEQNLRQRATTDENGFYTISRMYALSNSVTATKEGYDSDTRNVVISGDTRLDLQISPRLPHTLSGVVSEMTSTGLMPVEGVDIYCDACGSFGHTRLFTDVNGLYSFSNVYDGVTTLYARKEGFLSVRKDPTVKGDIRFDFPIVRR